MTDERHNPYVMQDPPQADSFDDLRDYLGEEFRKIEDSMNGVDLDVETRWGSTYATEQAYLVKFPPSYKEGSVFKPALTILFPNSATADTTLVYTLDYRVLTPGVTAGSTVSDAITATAQADLVKRLQFSDITATASIDSFLECSLSVANQDYSSTAPTILCLDVRFEMDTLGSEEAFDKL